MTIDSRPGTAPYWTAPIAELEGSLHPSASPGDAVRHRTSWYRILGRQFISPVTLILVLAAIIALAVQDFSDGIIVAVIVVASALLGFWQEYRASRDVELLLGQVRSTITVLRGGERLVVGLDQVVVGDTVVLSAGDVLPADCRLLQADRLSVDESSLTGESVPVEKAADATVAVDAPVAARLNCVFRGSHVVSGTGTALVVATGASTELGALAGRLVARVGPTSFERGVRRFGLLLLRVMIVLTIAVFVINLVLGRPLADALLFSLALAVGVTPQMLPVIVSVSLAAGARRLARNHVIVKRLDVIEDLGSLTVLCTDKTGTLTRGVVEVSLACDPAGAPSTRVMMLAGLNAGLQRGYANPLDEAVLRAAPHPTVDALGEVPYDFTRKRLSVAALVDGAPLLITKGAFEPVLACCTTVAGDDRPDALARAGAVFRDLSTKGYRVLAVASRPLAEGERITVESETGLALEGMLALQDELKEDAAADVADLAGLGVRVVMVTGDNALVARTTAAGIGLSADTVLTGKDIDGMSPAALRSAASNCDVFAEVEPRHKEEIVSALRAGKVTVGFLGDGINDSAALHAADVGISVDTATDVAKDAAAIVLLDKSLGVVADGVRLGRQTFANTLKYVRFASSSNFGNVLSMVIASAILPFLPMLPGQILLLNFLADIPNTLLSRDRVDPERLVRPGHWRLRSIERFMIVFGALSTVFDLVTFAVLAWGFHAHEAEFQSGWFIESAMTQVVVILSLRTQRPFFRSRPDTAFLVVALAVAVLMVVVPFLPFASFLGFVVPPIGMVFVLVGVAAVYLGATELVKRARWSGFVDRLDRV